MKKGLIAVVGVAMLLSGCGTYTATGAYTGGQFGHVIGSAVGGISGGWRGHEVGSIIGTVGGTVAGAAIGSAIERNQQRKYEQATENQRNQQRRSRGYDQSGYDQSGYDQGVFDPQGRGDDRITFMTDDSYKQGMEIRNIQIVEARRDGFFTRGEELTVVFEILNHGDHAVRGITPLVEEVTGNKHVHISPSLLVDRIEAHQGVRYTARVLADRGLRNGEIVIRVGVAEGPKIVQSQLYDFAIPTAKRLQ